jgi:hypothetical protein
MTLNFTWESLKKALGVLTLEQYRITVRALKEASIADQDFPQASFLREQGAGGINGLPIHVSVRSSSSCDGWTARTKTKPVCTASSTSCAYSAAAAAAAKHFGCERRGVALSTTVDDMPAWNKPGHFIASKI